MNEERILYGKDNTKGIVAIEWKDCELTIFVETPEGVKKIKKDHKPYVIYDAPVYPNCGELKGDLPLKYYEKYDSPIEARKKYYTALKKGYNAYKANNTVEGAMISKGYTFYKGMEPENISILSFDIETTTIDPNDKDAKILCIASTFRRGSEKENRLFCYDEYNSEESMIADFADYIRKEDPSIITGYNILGFDLPYIVKRHKNFKVGRNTSRLQIEEQTREKRKDASQSYSFHAAHIYGRQIIDAFHLIIDHDLASGRGLPSYKLKQVMKHLGLEKEGRQHYDAAAIKNNYHIPEEWEKIKSYNVDDGEDALKILDYIWEPYFYFTQYIPMTFERITQTATGTKVNNLMLRCYLQDGHSIPIGDEKEWYKGGMVIGNPGIYKHVNKVDVKSMYPSIMIQKNLCVDHKDPKKYFPFLVKTFTKARFDDKEKYAQTKIKKYDSMQAAKKIFINSLYGFLGAGRLNFNSMEEANNITKEGRDITQKGIDWAEGLSRQIVNADTDSFSYSTGRRLSEEEFSSDIEELNRLFPKEIEWENDGQYEAVLVLTAKNYVLCGCDGTITARGNSIKATMKEPALQEYIKKTVDYLLDKRETRDLIRLYFVHILYINAIHSVASIVPWCSKVTITKTLLEKSATRQKRLREALEGSTYSESDKIHVFFETKEKMTLRENFNGVYCRDKLYKKLHATTNIFSTVLDVSLFPDMSLKRNKELLELISEDIEEAIDRVLKHASENNEGVHGTSTQE